MPERAKVRSVDVIDSFRTAMVLYVSRARPVLEEVGGEVLRVRSWLETEQRVHWEGQLKRRLRTLEQAQQNLFSARISALREETAAEVLAVHRAKRAVEEAEIKLRHIKLWLRDFETRVQPLLKQIEKLHTLYANELPKGIAHLGQLVKTLEGYLEMRPAQAGSEAAAPPQATPDTPAEPKPAS